MASVKAAGVSAKQALLTLLLGAWVVFGGWGLTLFLTGEELGTLDKLILLVWVTHMGSLVMGRRASQQQSQTAPSRESGREGRARAFGLILAGDSPSRGDSPSCCSPASSWRSACSCRRVRCSSSARSPSGSTSSGAGPPGAVRYPRTRSRGPLRARALRAP